MHTYGYGFLCAVVMGLLPSLPGVAAEHVAPHTPVEAPARPQPGSRYHLVAVQYQQPRLMSMGAGQQSFSNAVEIQLKGVYLNGASLQPTVYLNGYKTSRTHVSPHTDALTAWLYGVSLKALKRAAIEQGGWSLEYQLPGGHHRLRVSPTGQVADIDKRPVILTSTR